MEPTNLPLTAVASQVALFGAQAIALAVMATALLVVLEEIWLRSWMNRLAIGSWLSRRLGRGWFGRRTAKSVEIDRQVSLRFSEITGMVSRPDYTRDASREQTRDVFWALISDAVALPPRQLLGVFAAAVQTELSAVEPSPFVRWFAVVGSLPITPSPFEAPLEPTALPKRRGSNPPPPAPMPHVGGTNESTNNPAQVQPASDEADSSVDVVRRASRAALQRNAERALDALQANLASRFALTRYVMALVIVLLLSAATTVRPITTQVVHVGLDTPRLLQGQSEAPTSANSGRGEFASEPQAQNAYAHSRASANSGRGEFASEPQAEHAYAHSRATALESAPSEGFASSSPSEIAAQPRATASGLRGLATAADIAIGSFAYTMLLLVAAAFVPLFSAIAERLQSRSR